MNKKRLSIFVFLLVIVIGIGTIFAHSKVETPDEHADNAYKISMVGEKGKNTASALASAVMGSNKSEVKDDTKSSKAADSEKSVENKSASKKENSSDKNKFEKPDASSCDKSLVQTPTSGASISDSNYAALLDAANHHTGSDKKDKYLTDPTPPGMPTPVEPQDVKIDPNTANYCTLSIRCDTILNNMGNLKKAKVCMVPSNGAIYETRKVVFYKGESVFNVLVRETAKNRIQLDFQNTPIYNTAYIKGIHNLYEFDCGNLSGWMYKVNGWFPNYGCSRYQIKPGDKIEWVYTCDLGRDVGCVWIGDKK